MEYVAITVSIISMIITGAALVFTISSFKKQLQLNYFADYTKRYQEIILQFPENINESNFKLDNLTQEVRDKTLRHMRAYFDLCSEEYWLSRKGHIDNETWHEWVTGIRFAFSKPAFKQSWSILQMDTVYYGEFVKFMSSSISDK